jgi:hypothetical protein
MEAKAMAKELEDNFTLLEINKEELISLFDRKAKVQIEHIEKLTKEQSKTLNAINEELNYLNLHYRLLLEVIKEFNIKDVDRIEALKSRLPLELLNTRHKPNSPQAVRRFYLCNAVYHNLLMDREKAQGYFLQAAEWWDQFEELKEEEFHRYINDVSNLVNICNQMERYFPIAKIWLEKLKKEKTGKSFHNQKNIFLRLSISNLLHLLNQNDFNGAKKLLPEIIEGLNKFGLKKSIVLAGNIATVYFLVEDYANCAKWSDFIIKNRKLNEREDIQRIVRLYKVASDFELGDIERAEADIRSTNRFYKQAGLKNNDFENVVLNNHFKKIFTSSVSESRATIRELKNYLQFLKIQPESENTLGIEELLIWADKKMLNS